MQRSLLRPLVGADSANYGAVCTGKAEGSLISHFWRNGISHAEVLAKRAFPFYSRGIYNEVSRKDKPDYKRNHKHVIMRSVQCCLFVLLGNQCGIN